MARKTGQGKAAPAKSAASDPFLAGGEERGQGARWAHDDDNVGSALLGRLIGTRPIKFRDGKEGESLVFSPAIVRDASGELIAHRVCETIKSAVLGQRITPESDKGVVFAIRFDGTEPSTTKGRADFKVFTVAEQKPAVLIKQLTDVGEPDLAQLVRSAE